MTICHGAEFGDSSSLNVTALVCPSSVPRMVICSPRSARRRARNFGPQKPTPPQQEGPRTTLSSGRIDWRTRQARGQSHRISPTPTSEKSPTRSAGTITARLVGTSERTVCAISDPRESRDCAPPHRPDFPEPRRRAVRFFSPRRGVWSSYGRAALGAGHPQRNAACAEGITPERGVCPAQRESTTRSGGRGRGEPEACGRAAAIL